MTTIRSGIAALLVLAALPSAEAQTGFYLPTGPTSAGQDEFHASDGTSCRTTMDGVKRLEVGSFGTGGDNLGSSHGYPYPYSSSPGSRRPLQQNAGVYARFSMSLDASRNRMDCNKLYELELERRRLEIELMKRSLVSADQKLDDLKRRDTPAPKNAKASSGLRGSFPPL